MATLRAVDVVERPSGQSARVYFTDLDDFIDYVAGVVGVGYDVTYMRSESSIPVAVPPLDVASARFVYESVLPPDGQGFIVVTYTGDVPDF